MALSCVIFLSDFRRSYLLNVRNRQLSCCYCEYNLCVLVAAHFAFGRVLFTFFFLAIAIQKACEI